jgi:tRNA G18 (ribose-2'-O)-methylase SpoU
MNKFVRAGGSADSYNEWKTQADDHAPVSIKDILKIRFSAAQPIDAVDWRQSCGFVIGSEGQGVRPEILAACQPVTIPTETVESLNAAVAAGIVLYEARRQRSRP